jgi:hypothetical protein
MGFVPFNVFNGLNVLNDFNALNKAPSMEVIGERIPFSSRWSENGGGLSLRKLTNGKPNTAFEGNSLHIGHGYLPTPMHTAKRQEA